jgi:hypothetical protein
MFMMKLKLLMLHAQAADNVDVQDVNLWLALIEKVVLNINAEASAEALEFAAQLEVQKDRQCAVVQCINTCQVHRLQWQEIE